ncbi:DUF1566 domain-containing protein [Bacteroides sp. 519]|uniref:Lcl domain-containing protein n=1 Tax=Bacteroides sp. 519 TaxID=2302937 RepID=UPI0013D747A9|nr:DUF1566 domain-containing protein [Bacteroides sp. 519]NDV56913.1 DUF1566 domain-containing protein [Bacteroides sp. 519]
MKKILITAILASLLLPAQLMAQKVYKDASNRVILDSSSSAGMPEDATTGVAKYNDSFAPSSTMGENNHVTGSINATVFWKLEVAPNDINTYGIIGTTGTQEMEWGAAFNACKRAGWRLPTQRELILMYIFKPALESLIGVAFKDNYWSATEDSDWGAWYVNLGGSGYTSDTNKIRLYYGRCVREVRW